MSLSVRRFAILVGIGTCCWAVCEAVESYNHQWQRHVDTLQDPVQIKGWVPKGLVLADGRIVRLPGFRSLPLNAKGLAVAIQNGVELHRSGRIFVLLHVHHRCGNERFGLDIRKVDLGHFMEFLREGDAKYPRDYDLPCFTDKEFEEHEIEDSAISSEAFYEYTEFLKRLDWDGDLGPGESVSYGTTTWDG